MFEGLDNLNLAAVLFKSGVVDCCFGLLVKFRDTNHTYIHLIRLNRCLFFPLIGLIMSTQKEILAIELSKLRVSLTDR